MPAALNVKVKFSDRVKAYMERKHFTDFAVGLFTLLIMTSDDLTVKALIRKEDVSRYESSKYDCYYEGDYRLFVSQDLTPVRSVITVDMKRFLGVPEFTVNGLAVVFKDDGSGGGGGGGHKEKARRKPKGAAAPVPEGI